MLSEFWGYLPYLFLGYGIFFKIIKGIWDTGTPPLPVPHHCVVFLSKTHLSLLSTG